MERVLYLGGWSGGLFWREKNLGVGGAGGGYKTCVTQVETEKMNIISYQQGAGEIRCTQCVDIRQL